MHYFTLPTKMVWILDKIRNEIDHNIKGDRIFQKTNLMLNVAGLEYNAFDLYYLWRVGVNVFNIDRTKHDEELFKNFIVKVKEAREYNHLDHYRPIGVAVTVSAKEPIEVDENVDVIIVNEVTTKDDLLEFRKKNNRRCIPILVRISSYALEDMNFIIRISDGVILDFFDPHKAVEQYCIYLIKQCREMSKPIIISRPELCIDFIGKFKELLHIANELVGFNPDGILLEANERTVNVVDGIYNILCAMTYAEQIRENKKDYIEAYFEMRAEVKIPAPPALSVAHAASLAVLHSGATLIIILSRSGRSARWISCASPPCIILAITTQQSSARQMHIYKKIVPLVYDKPSAKSWQEESWKRIQFGTAFALRIGLVRHEAKLVVMMPHGDDGYCNSFQIVKTPEFQLSKECVKTSSNNVCNFNTNKVVM